MEVNKYAESSRTCMDTPLGLSVGLPVRGLILSPHF